MKLEAPSLIDFFSERVREAKTRREVELSQHTEHYLAGLLVREGRSGVTVGGPSTLAEMHLEAASAPRNEAMRIYRTMGDRALYVSGYFQDSLSRRAVGVENPSAPPTIERLPPTRSQCP